MPYRRRKYTMRRRRTFKKRAGGFRGRQATVYRTAMRAANKVLRKNIETKYDIQSYTPSTKPNQDGAFYLVQFADIQDTGDRGARIGDRVKLKKFHINTRVRYQTTGTFIPTTNYEYQRVRQIIFEWNHPGSAPTYTDLFSSATQTDVMIEHFNHDSLKSGKLRILDDRVTTVWDPASSTPGSAEVRLSVPVKRLRRQQQFQNSGGASSLQHPMYIAHFTEWDTTTYTDFYPDVRVQYRVDYTDA